MTMDWRGILNGDGMVPSPETEISPEFPLITRGLKRKGNN